MTPRQYFGASFPVLCVSTMALIVVIGGRQISCSTSAMHACRFSRNPLTFDVLQAAPSASLSAPLPPCIATPRCHAQVSKQLHALTGTIDAFPAACLAPPTAVNSSCMPCCKNRCTHRQSDAEHVPLLPASILHVNPNIVYDACISCLYLFCCGCPSSP